MKKVIKPWEDYQRRLASEARKKRLHDEIIPIGVGIALGLISSLVVASAIYKQISNLVS